MLTGLLCLVTGDVVHAALRNLFLEVGLLLRPGTECAAQDGVECPLVKVKLA